MTAPASPETDVLGASTRARFVVESGWFDDDWYVDRFDVSSTIDPLEHWVTIGVSEGRAPGPQLASLRGQQGEYPEASSSKLDPPERDDPQLLRDITLVTASALFDEAYYRSQINDLDSEEPIDHFCRIGWRLLHRPCRGFDVWWYWSTQLDPGVETLNPFVHWLVLGRLAGWPGQPTELATTGGWTPPADRPMRRICLFAGYNAHGVLDDTVVAYVRELSRFADVYYLSDSYLPEQELAKLEGITRGAWAIRHGCYDFGSYSMLAHDLVGWKAVRSYDELLLVNDSTYLLRSLDDVFATMDERSCDWWGLQATKGLAATADAPSNQFHDPIPLDTVRNDLLAEWENDDVYDFHVGSYFLAYRRPVLDDSHFRRLLESVHRQRGKSAIIHKYEIGLTHTLLASGHPFDTYVDAVYPFHPLFTAWYFELLAKGFPLLKQYLIYQNHYDVPDLLDWRARIAALAPEADLDTIESHLLRTAPHDRLARSFAIRTDADAVIGSEVLVDRSFRRADRRAAKDDDWWAFPVCPVRGTLPASSRAILEQVRHDPSITKVVLTRSRRVELPGQNVVVLPLLSPDGQRALMRSTYVFVEGQPLLALGERLVPSHRLVLARDGLALSAGSTPSRPRRTQRLPVPRWHAVLAASRVDQLAALGANYPARYAEVWRTGIPAHDFLSDHADQLPPELVADEQRLRTELGERPLVVFGTARRGRKRAPYAFSRREVAWLADWSSRTGIVLGIREHPLDLDRAYAAQLPFALDLSHHRYPFTHAVLRAADAVLTDYSGVALDVRAATGRPVMSFAHDLDVAAPTLAFDLEHVFPGPVCRTFAEVAHALETVLDAPDPEEARLHEMRARLMADPADGGSAARAVALVRERSETGVVA